MSEFEGNGIEDLLELQHRASELLHLTVDSIMKGGFLRETCAYCGRLIGVRAQECTGWHPDFKCSCGYEAAGEIGLLCARLKRCPACGADQTLNADVVLEDTLDAEFVG